LNALPNPVWLKNAEGRIAWVNKAYTRAVEASDEAEVRRSQIELLESRQRADAERSLADGKTYRQRMALIAGGERRTHDVVMLPLEGATVAAATDVTELESARGDLDREIAAYDRTLHRVATATAIFGPDQRLTFFNEAYLKLWALDADWLKTQPSDGEILDRLRDLSRLPNALPYREWKARLLACYGKQRQHEDSWHLPDGRTLHVIAEQRPDGGVTYLYDDVTERIALESRFNELIDVQRETLDHLQEGVALFATDGRLRLFNSAFAQIWKLSRRALGEGPHVDDLIAQCSILFDHPPTWHIIQRAVTGISDTRSPYADQMVRPDASVIDFAVLPLPDGATLITFADVTAAKSYERALIERNEALVAADRLKSQFISHVSYELRTPLTNIIGFSELLESPRTGDLNAKQREYLGDITASSKTLLAIIDDILDLATMDAGTLELRLSDVDVNAVVEAAVLGVRERAMRSRIQLDIAIAPGIATFQGDENRVRQILYNLLSNAIGFSKAGSAVRLHVSADDAMIHFRVCDNGVGIPKDQQARVFERFESRSHGSNHRGAGLGLSVVKSLVELHGGTMTLQSEPGEGTSITAHLPLEGARRTPRPEDHDALAATQPLPSLQQAHALAQAASDTSVAALNQRVAQMAERAAQPAAATQPVEPPSSPSQAETSGPVLIASMPLDDAANG
ncbi:MAG: ATP-binding protein, partial [Pseudomonadota bacterium]